MNFNTGRLLDMLRTKRPYNNGEGTGAKEFTEKFIMPVARKYAHFVDSIGNVIIDLRGRINTGRCSRHIRTAYTVVRVHKNLRQSRGRTKRNS